jgi:hypothetical protein
MLRGHLDVRQQGPFRLTAAPRRAYRLAVSRPGERMQIEESIRCPTCGRDAETSYCIWCGSAVAEISGPDCVACGAPVAEWMEFCTSCGASTGGEPRAEAAVDVDSGGKDVETRAPRSPRISTPGTSRVCQTCGRPTAVGAPCRWCGAVEVATSSDEPRTRKRSKLLVTTLVVVIAVAVGVAAGLPWVVFSSQASATVQLLSPAPGQDTSRKLGRPVLIHGLVTGIEPGSEVSILINGESVWSETYEEGEPLPLPAASWTPDRAGAFEVRIDLVSSDGTVTSSDPATVSVSD